MAPTFHVNDANLIAEIEGLVPVPQKAALQMIQGVDFDADALEAENRNEAFDQEVQRPNQVAFDQYDFALRNWDRLGRRDPLPHFPAYLTLDPVLHHKWWGELQASQGSEPPKHYFIVSLPAPAMPIIASAALPPPPDPTASPVGAPMGAGYFASTPMGKMLPADFPVPDARSYTGRVLHVVFGPSPFYPMGLDFWIVG